MIMIINNGVENGKVYGKELEGSKTIKHKERIEINKTEEKENEIQEDETKGDKKNNRITLAIGCSIVLIVILALIISTIKNKSKKAEEEGSEEAEAGQAGQGPRGGKAVKQEEVLQKEEAERKRQQEEEIKRKQQEEIQKLLNKIFIIDVKTTEKFKDIITIQQYNIYLKSETEEEIETIILLNKEGKKIMEIEPNSIYFFSDNNFISYYKSINLQNLEINLKIDKEREQECDNKIIEQLQHNDPNITEQIKFLLEQSRESQQNEIANGEKIIGVLQYIKEDLKEKIKIYSKQQEKIQNLLNEIFTKYANKINQEGNIKITDKYKINVDGQKKQIKYIYLLNKDGETIMYININNITLYNGKRYKFIDLKTLKIYCYEKDKTQEEKYDNEIIEQLKSNNHDKNITYEITSLLKQSRELQKNSILDVDKTIKVLECIKEDLDKEIKFHLEQEEILAKQKQK